MEVNSDTNFISCDEFLDIMLLQNNIVKNDKLSEIIIDGIFEEKKILDIDMHIAHQIIESRKNKVPIFVKELICFVPSSIKVMKDNCLVFNNSIKKTNYRNIENNYEESTNISGFSEKFLNNCRANKSEINITSMKSGKMLRFFVDRIKLNHEKNMLWLYILNKSREELLPLENIKENALVSIEHYLEAEYSLENLVKK